MKNDSFVKSEKLYTIDASDDYILQVAVNREKLQAEVAAALSTQEICIFDLATSKKCSSFTGHTKPITCLKFSSQNLLFSSSLDGKILVWDSRSCGSPVKTFLDESDVMLKPLTCFDTNATEGYLCAGTEMIREDSFLIFWDIRSEKSLGGYWNSHTEEITQVHFHNTHPSSLASASVDGLINIFDLNQDTEEDALENTINAEASVSRFCWCEPDAISCVTSIEEFQFWNTANVNPLLVKSRSDLAEEFQQNTDYFIDTFSMNSAVYLASGMNSGSMQLFLYENNCLSGVASFENGHTDVIRTVNFCPFNKVIVTGSEDGKICIWDAKLQF